MESSKKQAGSGLSLTDYLFGAKGSSQPSNSSGIFSSIFPPPSAVWVSPQSCKYFLVGGIACFLVVNWLNQ